MQSLRDITLDLLAAHRQDVDPLLYRRAAYVIKENARVEAACGDLAKGDFRSFGQRMNESHAGLRDEYEVSCRELDTLVEAASGVAGVYGARMMGAGFGGCTINLVEESSLEEFRKRVIAVYERTFHKTPNIHMIRIEGGTRVIPDFTNS
jgi:galactokinase